MKLPIFTTGRTVVSSTTQKVVYAVKDANMLMSAVDSGRAVHFSGLPTLRFFVRPSWHIYKGQGFSFAEESTGHRVVWEKTEREAIAQAEKKISGFLRLRGYGALLRIIRSKPRLAHLSGGYDGATLQVV